MEKQHNRGQDGAGVASIKLDVDPGTKYISRYRSAAKQPLQDIFDKFNLKISEIFNKHPEGYSDSEWMKKNIPLVGELLLGHLRYGTFGKNGIENCHPFLRQNNWMTRNLVIAGNFNLTNVDELFELLVNIGQHPKEKSDTVTVLEKIGHFLDEENEELFRKYKNEGHDNRTISRLIADHIDLQKILVKSCKEWDGGYVIAGLAGHGDAFVLRDPAGIRPAYYYKDEEVVVVTSERPPIQTAFNASAESIKEISPGHALIIKKNGVTQEYLCKPQIERRSCSFERIYFSRGSDKDIYNERKKLGNLLVPAILDAVNNDLKNTVFSFIPNTAEVAFYGMVKGAEDYLNAVKKDKITKLGSQLTPQKLEAILAIRPRVEKIAIKDAKLRTFITADSYRNELVAHVYDITYGTIQKHTDNIVVIDDSIVRGTTLKNSILKIIDRLSPKKIVLVSSAPQIRYPDCYGIDMAKIGDLVAFRAAVELLQETNRDDLIDKIYWRCKEQEKLPKEQIRNEVKAIYKPFTPEQISGKIAELIRPDDINAEVCVLFQTIENLHKACPNHLGDWYFTGDYPTPGGNKVVNRAFINYVEKRNIRAY